MIEVEMLIERIDIAGLVPSDPQPASYLADHIRHYGLLQPILICAKTRRLVCGLRRLLACQMLGMVAVPVYLHYVGADPDSMRREEISLCRPLTIQERGFITRWFESAFASGRVDRDGYPTALFTVATSLRPQLKIGL